MSNKKLDIDMILKGFSQKDAAKMRQSGSVLKAVISSQAFKDRVCSYNYVKDGKTVEGFRHCELTGPQVYDAFMSGVDKYNTEKDGDLDIYVTLYYSSGSVIGYTYPSTWHTWLNSKYLKLWWNTPQRIAGNLGHEYAHNVEGINYHSPDWNQYRKYTAPYGIGYLIVELGAQYVSKNDVIGTEVLGMYKVCTPRYSWFPWVFKNCRWVKKEVVV